MGMIGFLWSLLKTNVFQTYKWLIVENNLNIIPNVTHKLQQEHQGGSKFRQGAGFGEQIEIFQEIQVGR